jgi:hypothetical protein
VTAKTTTASQRRRLGAGVVALAGPLALSGCFVLSPVTTDNTYDPAEGVSVETEGLQIENLLVVSEGEGAPGVISGYAVNTAIPGRQPTEPAEKDDISIQVALEEGEESIDADSKVTLTPAKAKRLDGRNDDGDFKDPLTVPEVPVLTGSMTTLRVTTSGGEAVSAKVPVLPPEEYYEPYAAVLERAGSSG